MRRTASFLLLAAAVVLPGGPSASAAQAACDFTDTPSFTNTAYMTGPGLHEVGEATDGGLHAYTTVDAGEPSSEWSKSTDRINGAHHVLSPGAWTVTWEWGTGYAGSGTDGVAQVVTRFGGQIEQFYGAPDVYFGGWSAEPTAPAGAYGPIFPPNQGESGAFRVPDGQTAEMDALFYIDAHVQRSEGVDAYAEVDWTGLSICWRNSSSSTTPVLAAAQGVTRPLVDPILCPIYASLAGSYGPVEISSEGDVDLLVTKWDCPPYDV